MGGLSIKRNNILSLLIIILLSTFLVFCFINSSMAQDTDLSVSGYNLISKVRVGRTLYDYTFTTNVTNNGTIDIKNVTATLTSLNVAVAVLDGELTFGDVTSGITVISSDTFTIRVNRLYIFNESDLNWDLDWDIDEANFTAILNTHDNVMKYFEEHSRTFGDDKARQMTLNFLLGENYVERSGISDDGTTIWIEYLYGIDADIAFVTGNVWGNSDAINGITLENSEVNKTDDTIVFPKNKNAIVIAPFDHHYKQPTHYIAGKLFKGWYQLEKGGPITGPNVTINLLKNISQYGVIVITTHGRIHKNQVVFDTGEEVTVSSLKNYASDLAAKRLVLSPPINGKIYYSITPAFIKHYASDPYPNSLIYITACNSAGLRQVKNGEIIYKENDSMSKAFLENGASTYFGWQGEVTFKFGESTGKTLFDLLIDGQKTVSEAYKMMNNTNPKTYEKLKMATNLPNIALTEKIGEGFLLITDQTPTGSINQTRPIISAKINQFDDLLLNIDLISIQMTLDGYLIGHTATILYPEPPNYPYPSEPPPPDWPSEEPWPPEDPWYPPPEQFYPGVQVSYTPDYSLSVDDPSSDSINEGEHLVTLRAKSSTGSYTSVDWTFTVSSIIWQETWESLPLGPVPTLGYGNSFYFKGDHNWYIYDRDYYNEIFIVSDANSKACLLTDYDPWYSTMNAGYPHIFNISDDHLYLKLKIKGSLPEVNSSAKVKVFYRIYCSTCYNRYKTLDISYIFSNSCNWPEGTCHSRCMGILNTDSYYIFNRDITQDVKACVAGQPSVVPLNISLISFTVNNQAYIQIDDIQFYIK